MTGKLENKVEGLNNENVCISLPSKPEYVSIVRMTSSVVANKVGFNIEEIEILPITYMHHKLQVFGFGIKNFAYVTDLKMISEEELNKLKNLDVLSSRIHRGLFTGQCIRVNAPRAAGTCTPAGFSLPQMLALGQPTSFSRSWRLDRRTGQTRECKRRHSARSPSSLQGCAQRGRPDNSAARPACPATWRHPAARRRRAARSVSAPSSSF